MYWPYYTTTLLPYYSRTPFVASIIEEMKKIILLLALLLWAVAFEAQAKKVALLIGVGNYPQYSDHSGWGRLSSANDVNLLSKALKQANFQAVYTLTEAQATHKGIINRLDKLVGQCSRGDVVLIHFSGHGQQMPDLMHDEKDRLTEAFIPYDAHRCVTDSYRGKAHLTDDEIRNRLTNLRNRLGPKGLLMVTLDACHSEGSTRDDMDYDEDEGYPVVRGTADIFELGKKVKITNRLKPDACRLIELSACKAGEKNWEYKGYGRLSFILAKKITANTSLEQLATMVVNDKTVMNRRQTPKLTTHPVGTWKP